MEKICIVCKNSFNDSGVRAYNGKGSFESLCSEECAKKFEDLSHDKFNQELEYYRELNNQFSKLLNKDKDSNVTSLNVTEIKQEIEILESIYGFSKEMLL